VVCNNRCPDDVEWVNITIQLWDDGPTGDRLCDISDNYGNFNETYDVDIYYNLKTGHWRVMIGSRILGGFDPSGYGRLNGCDDNSQYSERSGL